MILSLLWRKKKNDKEKKKLYVHYVKKLQSECRILCDFSGAPMASAFKWVTDHS